MKSLLSHALSFWTVVLFCNTLLAQTSKDTAKTPATQHPMIVDPGKSPDNMNVQPGRPHDAIVVLSDTGFISKTIEDNTMEIAMARQGMKNGNAQVRKIAAVIVKDHTAMIKKLQTAAGFQKNTDKTSKNKAAAVTGVPVIKIEPGGNFNSAWASQMLNMHVAKIEELERYAATTPNAYIQRFAATALPRLRLHKQMLEKVPGAKITKLPNTAIQ